MIKRRFYKEEHADGGGDSESSSDSDPDSDPDSPPTIHGGGDVDEGVPEEEHPDEAEEEKEMPLSPTSGSGYASEDSSGNEVGCDSSGLPVNEEDSSEGGVIQHKDGDTPAENIQRLSESVANKASPEDSVPDLDRCVLKFKSVFKCRLCPRIVCLNETTIRTHLTSKRHARSKKLLQEGRLKLTLNSDGEIEEEQETHAERHARTIALAQETDARKQKDKGQKRQRKRSKKKLRSASGKGSSKDATKKSSKKRRKIDD